jgi:hypothetical protein
MGVMVSPARVTVLLSLGHKQDLTTIGVRYIFEIAVLCSTYKLQYSAQGLIRQRSVADQTAIRLFKLISGTLY